MELQGAALALNHVAKILNDSDARITIETDSHSLEKIYQKMRRTGIPSDNNLRINKFFASMLHTNFKIVYVKDKELMHIDFLSRFAPIIEGKMPCNNCEICKIIDKDLSCTQHWNYVEKIS